VDLIKKIMGKPQRTFRNLSGVTSLYILEFSGLLRDVEAWLR
jgi:hypothetical protein